MIALSSSHETPKGVLASHAHRLRRVLRSSTVAVQRTIDVFAEEEIVLPTGPYQGYAFRCDRQPFARLFFDEINKRCWKEIAATGPSQSGKTLVCFVIPILFHVFELRESVIAMTPNDDIAREKWVRDLLPVIEQTRYRKYLPEKGAGAKGGFGDLIQFSNGGSIKWMTAGGTDQSRAHYTSRVIVMTEVDGMAGAAATSHETDRVSQVEARKNAWGDNYQIYKECTVSVPEGHIWQRYQSGTQSKILTPCPHCGDYVHLEREHLTGWKEAETDVQASRLSQFVCSSCGIAWTEDQRAAANQNAVLVHDGQYIENNQVVGEPKETFTLGFRWTAANNLLVKASHVGMVEWSAERETARDLAERKLKQQYWAEPYEDQDVQITSVDPRKLQRRQDVWPRGYMPKDARWITVGVDVGKRLLYWTAMATWIDGRRHILDYGRIEVASDDLGIDVALPIALSEIREKCEQGWVNTEGELLPAEEVWIDAGAWTSIILAFIGDKDTDQGRYRPSFGRGFGQQHRQWYNRPKSTGAVVVLIGDEFHISRRADRNIFQVEFNSDYYKTRLHMGLQTRLDETNGKVTLFKAMPQEHVSFTAQLAAERQVDKFIRQRGNVKVWEAHAKNNHWLDSTTIAMANSSFCMEFKNNVSKISAPIQATESPQIGMPSFNLGRAIGR